MYGYKISCVNVNQENDFLYRLKILF